MRAVSVFGILATIISLAAADPHGACGCQINTDGALDDDTTKTCCDRFGGTTTFLTTSKKVRFSGKYSFHFINLSMTFTIKRFTASAQAPEVFEIPKAYGIVVIEGASKTALLDSAIGEIESLTGGQNFGLFGKSRTFPTELLMNDLFIDLTERFLTDTCTIYYSDQTKVSMAEPQGLRRQDDDCHHTFHPAKRETDFGIAYAATDITRNNGAIRAVIGSDMWKDSRDPTDKDETLIELKKGDAILRLGFVFYGDFGPLLNFERVHNALVDRGQIHLGFITLLVLLESLRLARKLGSDVFWLYNPL
ncbi:phytanoyl dioxygenase [Fusarium beomiforme]|uniref:Phytanoyl dioxygenase n=1 Tax=Fusarium beomiforme TaxID=44412 RepID=A0A9P5A9N3_9HYPO|nr:phytanoyl dioxygenase [Fusarium beomiforme]